jgi:hypothetical protein
MVSFIAGDSITPPALVAQQRKKQSQMNRRPTVGRQKVKANIQKAKSVVPFSPAPTSLTRAVPVF